MNTFEFGDKVSHRTNNAYNTIPMDVINVDESKIPCAYYDRLEERWKEKLFDETELNLISKVEGGFH